MNATPRNKKSSRKQKGRHLKPKTLRRIALPIPMCIHQHHREKREYPLPSFHPGLRDPSPQKPATPPSRKASERRKHQRQKRPITRMTKDYHLPRPSHHLQKSEAKGRGSRFYHIACMTSYLSVRR